MQVVVLAAGLGTRLRPVTLNRSKAMVPVLGRPLVERVLQPWLAAGMREIVLVVGPEDREIRAHFGAGNDLGLTVRFVEQHERCGMAHALGIAAPHLHGDFGLTACDSLVSVEHVGELAAAHRGGSAVLSLMDVAPEFVSRSAAVELEGIRVRRIVEKPGPGEAPSDTVSLPHYILPRRLLELLKGLEPSARGEVELQSAIQELVDIGGRVIGVRTQRRVQVSNPEDLRCLNLELLESGDRVAARPSRGIGEGTVFHDPVCIEDGATVGSRCIIGPRVYLEAGCVVGDLAVVRDSVVLRDAWVADGCTVEGVLLS